MSDDRPEEMVFSDRAYKVVLALNAEYGCNMEGQPATEIVELAMRAVEAEALKRAAKVCSDKAEQLARPGMFALSDDAAELAHDILALVQQ